MFPRTEANNPLLSSHPQTHQPPPSQLSEMCKLSESENYNDNSPTRASILCAFRESQILSCTTCATKYTTALSGLKTITIIVMNDAVTCAVWDEKQWIIIVIYR